MATGAVPPELWTEFDGDLDTLIEGTKAAEDSYAAGRGMSLASIAVGSAVMRLTKVRSMAQSRDLQGTKSALEKATIKIREAAFTSSGDPEGATLGENLDILVALVDMLERMENPTSKRSPKSDVRANAKSQNAAVGKNDNERGRPETTREGTPDSSRVKGGLFHDLGIVEPDDDPLSCLADEAGSAGGGRPKMRFLVAPIDPKLLEKERKLYWRSDLRGLADRSFDIPASTSLRREGRQHVQILREALVHLQTPANERNTAEERQAQGSVPVETVLASTSNTSIHRNGGGENKSERGEVGTTRDNDLGESTVNQLIVEPYGSNSHEATHRDAFEMAQSLRNQVRQASKNDYWPRRSLAYTLEEQGEYFAATGNFSASCSAYSEASNMFRECSMILPVDPEPLLCQWVTAQRAREVGHAIGAPENEILQRCVKICIGSSTKHGINGCKSLVCYEAHQELAGALLLGGEFERCTAVCGHILEKHDANDAEALFSLAQALEALGRCAEARKCGERAGLLALAAERSKSDV